MFWWGVYSRGARCRKDILPWFGKVLVVNDQESDLNSPCRTYSIKSRGHILLVLKTMCIIARPGNKGTRLGDNSPMPTVTFAPSKKVP